MENSKDNRHHNGGPKQDGHDEMLVVVGGRRGANCAPSGWDVYVVAFIHISYMMATGLSTENVAPCGLVQSIITIIQ